MFDRKQNVGRQPTNNIKIKERERVPTMIVRNVECEVFTGRTRFYKEEKEISWSLLILCPIIDNRRHYSKGLLRVGRCVERTDLHYKERHPLILPGTHQVTNFTAKHHHQEVKH